MTVSTVHTPYVGAGKIHLSPYSQAGVIMQGYRYFGATEALNMTVDSTTIDQFTADLGIETLADSRVTRIARTGTFTGQNITLENMAFFEIGDVATYTQAGSAVVDEAMTVDTDKTYWFGWLEAAPAVRSVYNVTSVVITSDPAGTTYVEGTDYDVDLNKGFFYIIPGGAITDGTDILVDYTISAENWSRFSSSALKQQIVQMWFEPYSVTPAQYEWWAPKVLLTPGGDFAVKGAPLVHGTMPFQFSVLQPDQTSLSALYIDERPDAP